MLFLSALDECSDPLLASLAGTGAILDRTHASGGQDPLSSMAAGIPHYGVAGSSFANQASVSSSLQSLQDTLSASISTNLVAGKSIYMPPTSTFTF